MAAARARVECRKSLGRLVAFVVGVFVMGVLLAQLVQQWVDLPWWKVVRRCVSVAAALMLWVFIRRVHGQSIRSLGLGPWKQGRRDLLKGVVLGFGVVLGLTGLYLATQVMRVAFSPKLTLLYALPAMGLVAVLEELVFRGYVLQQLLACSQRLAVAGSSAAYALVHLRPNLAWPSTGFELVGLFILGWVLAQSVLHTRQLYFAIGLHAALAYCARVNKLLVEFTAPSLQWLVGTNRLVNGVVGWIALGGLAWLVRHWGRTPEAPKEAIGQREEDGMGKGRGLCSLVVAAVIGLSWSGSLAAGEVPATYSEGVLRKVGRGIANVVTSPLELIRTPTLVGEREGGLAGLTVGIMQGIGAGLFRGLSGAVDLTTFFTPWPNHFRSLVQPEFIYAKGDWAQ